jgi:hypothetical protein
MATSPEITSRKTLLVSELEATYRRAHGNGKSAYIWSQILFMMALGCMLFFGSQPTPISRFRRGNWDANGHATNPVSIISSP